MRRGESSAPGGQHPEGSPGHPHRQLWLRGCVDVPVQFESNRVRKAEAEAGGRQSIHFPGTLVAPLPRLVEEDETAEGFRIADMAGMEHSILHGGAWCDGEPAAEVFPIRHREHEGRARPAEASIVLQLHGKSGKPEKLSDGRGFVENLTPKKPGSHGSVHNRHIETESRNIQKEALCTRGFTPSLMVGGADEATRIDGNNPTFHQIPNRSLEVLSRNSQVSAKIIAGAGRKNPEHDIRHFHAEDPIGNRPPRPISPGNHDGVVSFPQRLLGKGGFFTALGSDYMIELRKVSVKEVQVRRNPLRPTPPLRGRVEDDEILPGSWTRFDQICSTSSKVWTPGPYHSSRKG